EDEVELVSGRRWFWSILQPIRDPSGDIYAVQVVSHDVTERKMAEDALKESESKLISVLQSSPDIIYTIDRDLRISYINRVLPGYDPEQIMGSDVTNWVPPEEKATITEHLQRVFKNTETINFDLLGYGAEGSIAWYAVLVAPIERDGQTVVALLIARDITERKEAEKSLRQAQEYAQNLIDSSLDMIISVDPDRIIVEFNRAAQETFGYSKEEAVGKCIDMLYADPSQGSRIHKAVRRTGRLTREILNKRKNGETFPCLLSTSVMRSAEGEFLGVMGVSRDITEQMIAQERLRDYYEQEREWRQNLEAEIERRAQFTRGLVHELKTPLTPMVASGQLLVEELQGQLSPRLLRLAENVSHGTSNLQKRVDELLDLARGELGLLELNSKEVDPLQLLRSVTYDMAPVASSREQSMVLELPSSLPPVWADEGRLYQVLLNLLNNAFKWTPKGGEVTLRAREEMRCLIAEIQDTGPGITAEEQQRLFDPYSRPEIDRRRLDGLGLGLSLCRTIVELHGGKIWVESEEGKGSTFGFSVPLRPDVS
ncbi:PAS domain S-box protein, partial [Chloroflexota bacterium]